MKGPASQQDSNLPKIGAPATRALAAAGVQRLEDLTKFTEKEIEQLHGVGPYALEKLRIAMAERGLSYRSGK